MCRAILLWIDSEILSSVEKASRIYFHLLLYISGISFCKITNIGVNARKPIWFPRWPDFFEAARVKTRSNARKTSRWMIVHQAYGALPKICSLGLASQRMRKNPDRAEGCSPGACCRQARDVLQECLAGRSGTDAASPAGPLARIEAIGTQTSVAAGCTWPEQITGVTSRRCGSSCTRPVSH